MFEVICGANYKTERGYNRHLVSGCSRCWAINRLQEVGGNMLNGGTSRDITIGQVNWLLGLSARAALTLSRYTRRSRQWFTIPGERPIQVTVWPNGAGVVTQGRSEAEEAEDRQTRIVGEQQRIAETVKGKWDEFTPEQQAAWAPVLEQLANNLVVK